MIAKVVNFLSGKKTYLVGAAGIVYGLGIGQHWWPHSATADLILGSTGAMTIRAAIQKLCYTIAAAAADTTPVNPDSPQP